MNGQRSMKRSGLSLVELMVVAAITGVLLSLIMTGVQAARQAARSLSCKNNLKQLALATLNYESAHQCMPPASTLWGHSTHLVLLPYLEQGPTLYDKINFSKPVFEIDIGIDEAARAVRGAQLSIFLCPEEGISEAADERRIGRTNYAGNFGVGVEKYGFNGALLPLAPIGETRLAQRDSGRLMKMADFTDGASNTALFSEFLISFEPESDDRRVSFHLPYEFGTGYQFDAFCALCSVADTRPEFQRRQEGHGQNWYFGWLHQTLYNHALSPNSLTCTYSTGNVGMGVSSASSMHSRGVNVAHADGSVRFYADDIALQTWRELGARDDATLQVE